MKLLVEIHLATLDSHKSALKEADEEGDETGPGPIILKGTDCQGGILAIKCLREINYLSFS